VKRAPIAAAAALAAALIAWRAPAQQPSGQESFERRCTGCHDLDKEKEGPHLRGVFGRAAGKVESFEYSDALRKSGIKWDAATLDKWLTDPETVVHGTDMAFRVPKSDERAAIIEYLRTLSR
jgi:cytochrome c